MRSPYLEFNGVWLVPQHFKPKSLANGESIAPEEKERRNGKRTMAYLETCDEKEGDFSSFTAITCTKHPAGQNACCGPEQLHGRSCLKGYGYMF